MQIDFFEVRASDDFTKSLDRLTRKKRFFSLPDQISELVTAFREGRFEGERITQTNTPMIADVYKMRLPNPDANIGKSGGYRVIYIVVTEVRIVVFLALYFKKEEADLPDPYIKGLIDGCLLDLLEDNEHMDRQQ